MANGKWFVRVSLAAALTAALAGCSVNEPEESAVPSSAATASPTASVNTAAINPVDEQPGTVYYEIFVRSFYDSNGTGLAI